MLTQYRRFLFQFLPSPAAGPKDDPVVPETAAQRSGGHFRTRINGSGGSPSLGNRRPSSRSVFAGALTALAASDEDEKNGHTAMAADNG